MKTRMHRLRQDKEHGCQALFATFPVPANRNSRRKDRHGPVVRVLRVSFPGLRFYAHRVLPLPSRGSPTFDAERQDIELVVYEVPTRLNPPER